MQRVDILDRGWVELQETLGSDQTIVAAARTSHLQESKGEKADHQLLKYLYDNKHTSPFEHGIMRYRICAPLMVWWHVLRHRTFSPNLQSGRYTGFTGEMFYTPDHWRGQSADSKQASSGTVNIGDMQKEVDKLQKMSYDLYTRLLAAGVAREQARIVLPGFAMYYVGVITADAHNLMNFFRQRLHAHTQYETRQTALAMFYFFKDRFPQTAALFLNSLPNVGYDEAQGFKD